MKLSVIIPCLKLGESLERAIRSIGTAPSGWEVETVVVEGLRPVGRARNAGLDRATGDYVAWVDGDDDVSSDWLSSVLRMLERFPESDVLAVDAESVGWKGRDGWAWPVPTGPADIGRLRTEVYRDMSFASNLWLFVSRRSLWESLRFDESVTVGEDYLMVPRLLARAEHCAHLGRALYRYHRNGGSLMSGDPAAESRERREILERRLAETPPAFVRAAAWGVGIGFYWMADLAALEGRETDNAAYGRRWIRRHFHWLLAEAFFGRWMPLRDRIGWVVRFVCAAMDFWWLQKRKARGRA